jgi:hypothetical protein
MFIQARNNVPLTSDFKPALKVLSRKPSSAKIGDASRGVGGLSLADEEDSEEEDRKKNAETLAERQAKAQREREEKQRKYQEVRERLFGSSAPGPDDGQSRASSKNGQQSSSRNSSRAKGRGKGEIDSQTSSADQSPARGSNPKRQLYDPNYTPKPQSLHAQGPSGSRPATPGEEQPIRQPRGPDGSGRGGFGFAARGGRVGSAT